jgi:hypothetical protein
MMANATDQQSPVTITKPRNTLTSERMAGTDMVPTSSSHCAFAGQKLPAFSPIA